MPGVGHREPLVASAATLQRTPSDCVARQIGRSCGRRGLRSRSSSALSASSSRQGILPGFDLGDPARAGRGPRPRSAQRGASPARRGRPAPVHGRDDVPARARADAAILLSRPRCDRIEVGGFGGAARRARRLGDRDAAGGDRGTNDDDEYTVRVTQRIARRSGDRVRTDVPGIVFLEIDGLALPVLQRAMRDGNAPEMARWLAEGTHRLVEWETDLSSQTGASQAGILLGSNEDIPAFRWVEKERGA